MSKNNTYGTTSFTLGVENRSLDNVIFHPTKPVLDSELNGMTDVQAAKLQDMIRGEVPSGWLDAVYSIGHDNSAINFGINTTDTPDTFYLYSQKDNPSLAVVNGWLIQVGGSVIGDTGTVADNKVKIKLSSPPSSGSRSDLVFLEVWKEEIKANNTQGKPSSTTIFKYGNTQYTGTNLTDEIVNALTGFETTSRVQIQYRIRVVDGVNFSIYPEGLDDINLVFAQGGATLPNVSYTFSNAGTSLDDYGLYIAGDGSTTAKSDLNTVDGYVYAIPMIRIHRRNTNSYSNANQNGSNVSILSSIPSDRPDGLFYDKLDKFDIEDLRHKVTFGSFNYQELLEYNFDNLLSGEMNSCLTPSSLDSNLERTNLGFYINTISVSTDSNTNRITQPNGQQRYYSDVPNTIYVTEKRTVNNKTSGIPGGNWLSTDQIQINVLSGTLGGAVIGTGTPVVKFCETSSGPIDDITSGSWASLGTGTATFTLGTIPAPLTNQELYITYTITYGLLGDKLTKPLKEMLKVENKSYNQDWGFVSTNENYHSRNIVPRTVNTYSDYAYAFKSTSGNGFGNIVYYYVNGNGSQLYTIPGNLINSQDTAFVYEAYDMYTSSSLNITGVTRNPVTFALNVTLPSSVAPGRTIRFAVTLIGGVLEYDERTQSVTDLSSVNFYEIMGNNTSTVILKGCLSGDPEDIVVDVQRETYSDVLKYPTSSNLKTVCYVDNLIQFCQVDFIPNTSLVKLIFSGSISSTSKITIALWTKKTLTTSDNLHISYNYKEYKGITKKGNFGTGLNSYINSKTLYHDNSLIITDNGTGGVNSSEELPKKYEPIALCCPFLSTKNSGNLVGTLHTKKQIVGGSYSLDNTSNNAPYTSGKSNYMSKYVVSNEQGTYKGGVFVSSAEQGNLIEKLIIGTLIEMVTYDGTTNFLPGELALRVETNYIGGLSFNRITNFDFESTNCFDLFKIEGKPLYKVKNK